MFRESGHGYSDRGLPYLFCQTEKAGRFVNDLTSATYCQRLELLLDFIQYTVTIEHLCN